MDFLGIAGKTFLLFGVANRKSIAWYVGQTLEQCGAMVLYSVRSEQRKSQLSQWIEPEKLFICDVEREEEIARLRSDIEKQFPIIDGILHSIAFANFSTSDTGIFST